MYHGTLPVVRDMAPWALAGTPRWERRAFGVAGGLLDPRDPPLPRRRRCARRRRAARTSTPSSTRSPALLADGRPFLTGERFTAADLTFGALSSAVLMPAAYGSPLPPLDALPDAVAREVRRLREHPAGRFAARLYAAGAPVRRAITVVARRAAPCCRPAAAAATTGPRPRTRPGRAPTDLRRPRRHRAPRRTLGDADARAGERAAGQGARSRAITADLARIRAARAGPRRRRTPRRVEADARRLLRRAQQVTRATLSGGLAGDVRGALEPAIAALQHRRAVRVQPGGLLTAAAWRAGSGVISSAPPRKQSAPTKVPRFTSIAFTTSPDSGTV